jgi:hypothetical protein
LIGFEARTIVSFRCPLNSYPYIKTELTKSENKLSTPHKIRLINITIMKIKKEVRKVSCLVGHTTFLSSARDSFIKTHAAVPFLVSLKRPIAKITKIKMMDTRKLEFKEEKCKFPRTTLKIINKENPHRIRSFPLNSDFFRFKFSTNQPDSP